MFMVRIINEMELPNDGIVKNLVQIEEESLEYISGMMCSGETKCDQVYVVELLSNGGVFLLSASYSSL